MNLSKEQKKKRKAFAKKMEKAMLFIFSLISVMREYNRLREDAIIERMKERYRDVVKDYMDIDKYVDDYITEFSEDVVKTTLKYPDDEYYLSEDRAILISENEANTSLNYQEYIQEVKTGKKYKRWVTENDEKVRETHKRVHNEVIPIQEAFLVGNSLMLFPKDTSFGASGEETVNCRCTIQYY